MATLQKYKIFGLLLKLSIVGISIYYIIYKISSNETVLDEQSGKSLSFESWKQQFVEALSESSNIVLVVGILVLFFFNWGIEAYKWRYLINKISKISFFKSYKAVLTGVTTSIFTPYRIGEYVGRVVHLEHGTRIKAVVLTILGSMSQLFITIAMGSIALIYLFPFIFDWGEYSDSSLYYTLIGLIVLFNIVLCLLVINPHLLYQLVNRFPVPKKWKRYINVLNRFNYAELFKKVVLMSLLRYFTFSLQFMFCLYLFDVNLDFGISFLVVSLTFLGLTLVNVASVFEMGFTRSAFCLMIVSHYLEFHGGQSSGLEIGIMAASNSVWLVNLALPALIGSFFIFETKIFKSGV